MKKFINQINHILSVFYKSTGIEAVFVDKHLNLMVRKSVEMEVYYDRSLRMHEVFDYLADTFYKEAINETNFYTYFFTNHLVSNIVFVKEENKLIGAFITEPASLDKETKSKLEKSISITNQVTKYKKELESMVSKIPVIHSDRIGALGIVLLELSKNMSKKEPGQVILKKEHQVTKISFSNTVIDRNKIYNDKFEEENIFFSFSLKLSSLVRSGDVQGVMKLLHSMDTSYLPLEKIRSTDFLRIFKNQLIKICSLACFIAIEAKASYHKTMNATDGFRTKVEELDHIGEIFHLFKITIIGITNLVAKSNVTLYSKPVHQAMDYITFHYAEKITLKKLAEHTRLSTSYLSKQIKKETGMNLVDNINRVRIERSKELLVDDNISILEVAHSVGFVYQNHFASVFRRFMSITPTAYKKSMGKTNQRDEFLDILPTVMEQILNKDLLLSHYYQTICIINPLKETFLKIDSVEQELDVKVYSKYKKEYEKYLVNQSFIKDQTIYQLQLKEGRMFLLIATPRRVYKTTYIIQFTIDISDSILVDKENRITKQMPLNTSLNNLESHTNEIYDLVFINHTLPIEIRKNILEKRKLFLVTITIDNLVAKHEKIETLIRQGLLQEITKAKDWVGKLSNHTFILVLHDMVYDEVLKKTNQIKCRLENEIIKEMGNLFHYNIKYGVKEYREDINDMEDFILLALKDMEQRFPYL